MGLKPPPRELVMAVMAALLDWDVGAWCMSMGGMAWESAAVGLKPPSREHEVAADRLTAGKGTRRQAGSLPPPVGVDDDAVVDLLDQADHEVVHVAVVGVAGLVMSSFGRQSWCSKPQVELCPWITSSRSTSDWEATPERFLIVAKMA